MQNLIFLELCLKVVRFRESVTIHLPLKYDYYQNILWFRFEARIETAN